MSWNAVSKRGAATYEDTLYALELGQVITVEFLGDAVLTAAYAGLTRTGFQVWLGPGTLLEISDDSVTYVGVSEGVAE